MKTHGAVIGALIGITLLATSCASAQPASKTAEFPPELHGVWEGGVTSCKKPGNLDTDQHIEIQPRKLLDYEQWQDLIEISPLSQAPRAWKVRSLLHIDEETSEVVDIFLLSGEDQGLLTVVNTRQSTLYVRCR